LRFTRLAAGAATLAIAAAGTAAALPATAAAKKPKKVTLIGSGSSAAQTYIEDLFAAYRKTHRNLSLTYNPDGGNAGVKDVQDGKSQFAIQTSQPSASAGHTKFIQLFLDVVTISVNISNPLNSLSFPEAKNIFLGTDTNWSQVPGSGKNTTIDPYGRDSTAGLYTIFSKTVLDGQSQSSNVTVVHADGDVATRVSNDPNGIGYIGLVNSGRKGIKRLKLSLTNGGKAFAPTTANIKAWANAQAKHKTGGYPLTHFDWVVLPTKKKNATVNAFFKWVINSKAAGKVITKSGAVPYFNKK
jgi:phosphate transport system substrate-binding protein